MTDRDPRQPIEFEPVSVGRRDRRFDPALLWVIVVAIGLTAAVLKPWDVGSRGTAEVPPIAQPSSKIAPSARPIPPEAAVAAARAPSLTWTDIASIIRPHGAWGVRAILRSPSRTATGARAVYDERWTPITTTGPSGPRAVMQVGERAIVAIGITFPDGSAPLDVRIWRRTRGGSLFWLDAAPIGRLPAQGGLIFAPPLSDPGAPGWGAGEYRIDALIGGGVIQRFELDIPDRYEQVRPSSIDPPFATELVSSFQVNPASVPVGPFATIDRVGLPLDSLGGAPLDAVGAWLDTDAGSGRVPVNHVAIAYLPRATGLGVRLPDGATVRAASISRLAPGPFINGPAPIGGGIIDGRNADPWVVFAARRGDAWAPGVYRIDVAWSEDGGLREAAWQIELRPGPSTGPPPLLAITRAWARHGGGSGIVVGRAEPLEGGPRSSAIRLLRIGSPDGSESPDRPAATCGGAIVDGSPEAFGLAYPVDDPVRVTSVRMDEPGRPAKELATLQARDVVPGLSLIVPTVGASFPPGVYRLAAASALGSRTLTLCVGGAVPR